MLERVIEEKARGDANAAISIRSHIQDLVGSDLRKLKPGSPRSRRPERNADQGRRLEPVS